VSSSQQGAEAPSITEGGGDIVSSLQRLAALKESGALTEKEFVAAKSKLLA
jgi:hypothetical protein